MLLTIANHKGGTGKTTTAMLLTSLAATIKAYQGKVYAADLDEQLSFRRRVKEINTYDNLAWNKILTVKKFTFVPVEAVTDPLVYAGDPSTICICDTPPSLMSAGASVAAAIAHADLLIISTTSDRDAIQAAVRTATAGNRGILPSVAVLTRVEGIIRDQLAEEYLQSKNVFTSTFVIYKNNQLVTNIDTGRPWWVGMRAKARKTLITDIKRMLCMGGIKA